MLPWYAVTLILIDQCSKPTIKISFLLFRHGSRWLLAKVHPGLLYLLSKFLVYFIPLLLFFLFFCPLDFILESNFLVFFFFNFIFLLLLLFLLLYHLSDGFVALFLLFLILHFLGLLQESYHTIHRLQRSNTVMLSACLVVL